MGRNIKWHSLQNDASNTSSNELDRISTANNKEFIMTVVNGVVNDVTDTKEICLKTHKNINSVTMGAGGDNSTTFNHIAFKLNKKEIY